MSIQKLLRASSEAEFAYYRDHDHDDDSDGDSDDDSDGDSDGDSDDSNESNESNESIPVRLARPPRGALLTMRDVRAIHAGKLSVSVVEPQDYTRVIKLTRGSRLLRDFYPSAGHTSQSGKRRERNERTGLAKGSGAACTGTGGDTWWVVGPELVAWLKERTRWLRGAR